VTHPASLSIAAFMAAFLCPAGAFAQTICGTYDALTGRLAAQYGERVVAIGLSNSGRAYVEFWASESGGTWSVITTLPNGVSCLTSSGRDFQFLVKPAEGKRT